MDSSSDDVIVYVDTSLNTHLAITGCSNDTVAELKRKLEFEHRLCSGDIKVKSLKVNWKGCFYVLSDTVSFKQVVDGGAGTDCCLYADVEKNEAKTAKRKRRNEKRKLKSVTAVKDCLKVNTLLICDSSKDATQLEIASELAAEKNTSTDLLASVAETSELLGSSSRREKSESKNKLLSHLHQLVDATLSGSGDMVAPAELTVKISSGEDIESITRQGLKENSCASINEVQENHEVPSSLDVYEDTDAGNMEHKTDPLLEKTVHASAAVDVNKDTDAGNVERKSDASLEKSDHASVAVGGNKDTDASNVERKSDASLEKSDHAQVAIKAPREGGTTSVERVPEKIDSSYDYEAILPEDQGVTNEDRATVLVRCQLSDANELVSTGMKNKENKKTRDSIGESLATSSAEHIKDSQCDASSEEPHAAAELINDSQCDVSLEEPHGTGHGDQDSAKAEKENGEVSKKETDSSRVVMQNGNEMEASPQIGKSRENVECTKKKSKRKQDAMTKDFHELEAEDKSVGHEDPARSSDNITETVVSKRKKSRLAKTTPNDQSNANLESGKEYGVETGTLPTCSNSRSTKATAQAPERIFDHSGNHDDFSCDREEINFHKHIVPTHSQNEVVASGVVHAEEETNSRVADSKPKRKIQNTVASSPSSVLRTPHESHEDQGVSRKSEAGTSSFMHSKLDCVVPRPDKSVSKKVSKVGTNAVSSDASGKIKKIPIAAKKQSVVGSGSETLAEMKRAIANSKKAKSEKKDKSHTDKKRHSSDTIGEVLGISKAKRTSAKSVAPENRNGNDEGKIGVHPGVTISPSHSLSSSDYSDGDSIAEPAASSGKKGTTRSSHSSIKRTSRKGLTLEEVIRNPSTHKKAKLAAELEEESQIPEFVPESQPLF